MSTEPEIDPTQVLLEIRRAYRTINDRGVTEEQGMLLAQSVADLDDHIDAGGYLPDQWRNQSRGRPRATSEGEVLDSVKHGTRSGYNRGCRCGKCRKANREHAAARIANQRSQ